MTTVIKPSITYMLEVVEIRLQEDKRDARWFQGGFRRVLKRFRKSKSEEGMWAIQGVLEGFQVSGYNRASVSFPRSF